MESTVLARDSRSLPYVSAMDPCVELACSPYVIVGIPPGFPLQSKNILRLNGVSKLPIEKQLQVHQYTLSKGMSPRLLELIFSCLSSNETLTDYEGQVIRSQPTDLQKTACFMQTLIRKGRCACRLFYEALESLDPSLFEQVTGVRAKHPIVATPCPLQDRTLPNEQSDAPTYVVNIQNSTLVNCILGHNNEQYINSDQQGQLLRSFMESRQDVATGSECMCCQKGAAQTTASSTNLQVHGSNLEYVIIGDKNSLTVEEGEESSEPEE